MFGCKPAACSKIWLASSRLYQLFGKEIAARGSWNFRAMFALKQIARSIHLLSEGTLELLDRLVWSPNTEVRMWTCVLLLELNERTYPAILRIKLFPRLVRLLRDENPGIIDAAVYVLSVVTHTVDCVQAVIDAGALDILQKLPGSREPWRYQSTFLMLSNLGHHQPAVVAGICTRLALRFYHECSETDNVIVVRTLQVLAEIALWANGARDVVQAGIISLLNELVNFPILPLIKLCIPRVHPWVTRIRGNEYSRSKKPYSDPSYEYSYSDPMPPGHGKRHPGGKSQFKACRIVASHPRLDLGTRRQLSLNARGALAVWEAGVVHTINQLLKSSDINVRMWACNLLGLLGRLPPTVPAIWEGNRCTRLLELSRTISLPSIALSSRFSDDAPAVAAEAMFALSQAVYWVDGAAAVVEAGALQLLDQILESAITGVYRWMRCYVRGYPLLQQQSGFADVIAQVYDLNLSSDEHPNVIAPTCLPLSRISSSVGAAHAVIKAGANYLIDQLLESPTTDIRTWACSLLGNLARLQSTVPTVTAVWGGNRCRKLVELSRDAAPAVSANAIAKSVDGAADGLKAEALQKLDDLLHSTIVGVRWGTCWMVGNLASHESALGALLGEDLCGRLVELIRDKDPTVNAAAACALFVIGRRADGAQTLIDTGALGVIVPLLGSSTFDVHR
ncbi:armadillo-type protein [Mycena leptocephala]|nr:armadillo-type protein [Mycena leptocephala]